VTISPPILRKKQQGTAVEKSLRTKSKKLRVGPVQFTKGGVGSASGSEAGGGHLPANQGIVAKKKKKRGGGGCVIKRRYVFIKALDTIEYKALVASCTQEKKTVPGEPNNSLGTWLRRGWRGSPIKGWRLGRDNATKRSINLTLSHNNT